MTDKSKKAPSDFVEEKGDHSIITLSRDATIGGAKVKFLRMREPSTGDALTSQESSGSDAQKEVLMFCNLCEISPDELKKLPFRDYGRLQAAFALFTI